MFYVVMLDSFCFPRCCSVGLQKNSEACTKATWIQMKLVEFFKVDSKFLLD